MNRFLVFLLLSLITLSESNAGFRRMRVKFSFRDEKLNATFFTRVPGFSLSDQAEREFSAIARNLDEERVKEYLGHGHHPTPEEIRNWRRNFFAEEPIEDHDEIMVVHRGSLTNYDILGLIATQRSAPHLAERRLARRGIRIPKQTVYQWAGPGLPSGVFPHWSPQIADTYFRNGLIGIGGTVQVNAFISKESVSSLIHTLASTYGIFSTGQLLPAGTIIDGIELSKPTVLIPSLYFWEVFNKAVDGEIRQGSRTRFYQSRGAKPLEIGNRKQWGDPLLGSDIFVQLLHKKGREFREGWTADLAQAPSFALVEEVEIDETVLEDMGGAKIRSIPSPVGRRIKPCVHQILDAPHHPSVETTLPISISISFNGSNAVPLGQPINLSISRPAEQPFNPSITLGPDFNSSAPRPRWTNDRP